ncbi:minor structural protein [Cyanophage S-2L]|nr:minor structural protein [Cyanophage S-2L]
MAAQTPTPPVAEPTPEADPAAPVAPSGDVAQQLSAALAKLDLVKQDKQRLGQTNTELNQRLTDLERQLREQTEAKLEDQQQYKALWEAAKQTVATLETEVATLKTQIETEKEGQQRERLKSSALAVFHSAGVVAPEQLYTILGGGIRQTESGLAFLQGGVERDLAQYVASLKAPNSGFEHHFAPSGGRGMGTPVSAAPVGGGGSAAEDVSNPWTKAGWNRTGQLALQAKNPELAAQMKAAAGVT